VKIADCGGGEHGRERSGRDAAIRKPHARHAEASVPSPHARRLGSQADDVRRQSELARMIFRDHLISMALIAASLVVQVAGGV
jgi:hypothetical protein